MASQLSKKAALPLAKILATCRNNVSNTGPSNVERVFMTLCHHISATGIFLWIVQETKFHSISSSRVITTNLILWYRCWLDIRWRVCIGDTNPSSDFNSTPPEEKWPPLWQTTIWNDFFWMKTIEFRFKCHWNLFPEIQLTINQHCFR